MNDDDLVAEARRRGLIPNAPSGQSVSNIEPGTSYRLDMNREVPLGLRLFPSLKMTPEGRQGALESDGLLGSGYGKGNIVQDPNGEMYVKDPSSKSVYPVNKPGLSFNDIGDTLGEAVQTVATLGARNPLTAAGAGAIGSAVRQGLGLLVPGEDKMGIGERLLQTGESAAMAGAGQFAGDKIVKALNAGRPSNIVAGYVNNKLQSPIAQDAADLTARSGVEFTPGQSTGARSLLTMEGLARRNPASADIMQQADQTQLDKALGFLKRTLDSYRPGEVGDITMGEGVSRTFNNAVQKAQQLRSNQARTDFGAVDALSNGQKVIVPQNVLSTVDGLISKFDAPGGGDATASLVSRLKSLRGEIAPKDGIVDPLSADQTQRLLEIYGNASKGTGDIFKDIDKGQQRYIAGQLKSALENDLDAAASNADLPGHVASALQQARANYKANSQTITELGDSVLGRLFGGKYDPAPERVADAFARMKPTEIKSAFGILEQHDPGAAQEAKRYLVERVMDKSQLSGSQQQIGGINFSPAKFVTGMKDSPVWATLTASEKFDMETSVKVFGRLADRGGTEGSPTAPLQMAMALGKAIMGGVANPMTLVGAGASVIAPRAIARAVTTPEGRKALITISSAPPGSTSFAQAAVTLGGLAEMAPDAASVNPDADVTAAQRDARSRRR